MTARLIPPLRIALAEAGAFGRKHLDALAVIEEADVVAVVSRRLSPWRPARW
jgi:2-hydroxy-4-carboxymuconate semialdehyde hemiacetal dehydrogenase